MGVASFRLNPGAGVCGSEFLLEAQGIARAADYVGKVFTVRIFEVDAGAAAESDLMAEFSASIENQGTKVEPKLVFSQVKRTDTRPSELPKPVARKSAQGDALPFQPAWNTPHFKLRFGMAGGPSDAFTIMIPPHEKEKEGYAYELAFRIRSPDGFLFDSSKMPALLDCTRAMAENCKQATLELFQDHQDLVKIRGTGARYGSKYDPDDPDTFMQLRAKYALTPAHCIGYLLEAGKLGHEKSLANADWKGITGYLSKGKGTTLAKGLEAAGWTGIYYCLDAVNPMDKGYPYKTPYFSWTDHAVTYGIARKQRRYYGLQVHDLLVNYHPTEKFWDGTPVAKPTPKDATKITKLKSVPFAILNARAGEHTAILAGGEVFEVHWTRGPDDPELYAKTDFETDWKFPWLSGIIHVPPGLW